jgi:hypothetical protein
MTHLYAPAEQKWWYPDQHVHVRRGQADGYDAIIIDTNQIVSYVRRDDGRGNEFEPCRDLSRKPGRPRKRNNVFMFPQQQTKGPRPAAPRPGARRGQSVLPRGPQLVAINKAVDRKRHGAGTLIGLTASW